MRLLKPSALGFTLVAVLGAGVVLMSCSGSRDGAPSFSPTTGQHPDGWRTAHALEYVKNPDGCRTCHGSTTDPMAAGGTSGVSCFTCHAKGPNHPAGWADPGSHGRMGAQLPPGPFSGFASCAKCHGDDFKHGVGTAGSCYTCHTKAPHPDRPWKGAGLNQPNHDKTDLGNAPVCFTCHAAGANSVVKPKEAPAPGAAPGCFNNTMCHGRTF